MPALLSNLSAGANTLDSFANVTVSTSFVYGSNTKTTDTLAVINGAAGTARVVSYQTAGLPRFNVGVVGNAESGNNAGSSYVISRWSDAGAYISDLFVVYRDSGIVYAPNSSIDTLVVNTSASAPTGISGDASNNVATNAFVANAVDGMATFPTTGGTSALTQPYYSAAVLIVTGTLASNAVLIVPNNGIMAVFNRTAGAFSLTVKTAAGTGITIAQGYGRTLAADGTNVVPQNNDYTDVTNFVGANVKDYVVGAMQSGTGASNLRLLIHYLPHAITLPAGLAGSGGVALTAATASTAFVLAYRRSGTTTTIATFTFAASGTTATISGVTIPTLVAGDLLLLTGPATADATLADVGFSILGIKQ